MAEMKDVDRVGGDMTVPQGNLLFRKDNQSVTQCLSGKLKSWTGLYSARMKSNEKNNCNMITRAVSEEHEVMCII